MIDVFETNQLLNESIASLLFSAALMLGRLLFARWLTRKARFPVGQAILRRVLDSFYPGDPSKRVST